MVTFVAFVKEMVVAEGTELAIDVTELVIFVIFIEA